MLTLTIEDEAGRSFEMSSWDGQNLSISDEMNSPFIYRLRRFLQGKDWNNLRLVVTGDDRVVHEVESNYHPLAEVADLVQSKGHVEAALGALATAPMAINHEEMAEAREYLVDLSESAERQIRAIIKRSKTK